MAVLTQLNEKEILIQTGDGRELILINDPTNPYDIEILESIWRDI